MDFITVEKWIVDDILQDINKYRETKDYEKTDALQQVLVNDFGFLLGIDNGKVIIKQRVKVCSVCRTKSEVYECWTLTKPPNEKLMLKVCCKKCIDKSNFKDNRHWCCADDNAFSYTFPESGQPIILSKRNPSF